MRSDYINPIDLCNRLNTYIIPEAAVHGFLTFLFLINGYWLPLILNLPLLAWNAKKYVSQDLCAPASRLTVSPARIVDNTHLLDATEIFRKLNVHKKVRSPALLRLVAPLLGPRLTATRNPLPSWASTWSCSSSTSTA